MAKEEQLVTAVEVRLVTLAEVWWFTDVDVYNREDKTHEYTLIKTKLLKNCSFQNHNRE